MTEEELIKQYEILHAKKIKILKSFKDGDFFKITSNNKIVKWGSFENFKVTENGVIISTHMYYDANAFRPNEYEFILLENSGAIEKMKSTELLIFMCKLRERNFTFDRRNKIIINI
jgi:predicted methyltransferase